MFELKKRREEREGDVSSSSASQDDSSSDEESCDDDNHGSVGSADADKGEQVQGYLKTHAELKSLGSSMKHLSTSSPFIQEMDDQ